MGQAWDSCFGGLPRSPRKETANAGVLKTEPQERFQDRAQEEPQVVGSQLIEESKALRADRKSLLAREKALATSWEELRLEKERLASDKSELEKLREEVASATLANARLTGSLGSVRSLPNAAETQCQWITLLESAHVRLIWLLSFGKII